MATPETTVLTVAIPTAVVFLTLSNMECKGTPRAGRAERAVGVASKPAERTSHHTGLIDEPHIPVASGRRRGDRDLPVIQVVLHLELGWLTLVWVDGCVARWPDRWGREE